MPDWKRSMQRSYEYYVVNPRTWKDMRPLTTVKSCTITRDREMSTLGSATFDIAESVGEQFIRVYMITIQDGVREKHPLGTFLVQTPTASFDGKITSVSMDAYTPLLLLKEKQPPIGYSILEGENIMERVCKLVKENAVGIPIVTTENATNLSADFVAETDDTWLTYLTDLLSNVTYRHKTGYVFDLDEMGRIQFAPKQDIASLQPIWTFDDSNSSILLPGIDLKHDLYGVPNVVEVLYSTGNRAVHIRKVNDNPNSPTSTISRGREIVYREVDPKFVGVSTERQIEEYAIQLLEELSTVEYTVKYTHGYCPVRLDDCVRLNCSKAGLSNVKAKVISQTIKCTPDCPVTETAVYTNKLYGGDI